MVHGTLEVLLVGAKGLENTDYLCNMDPYAILKCRSQEQKSSIATGGYRFDFSLQYLFLALYCDYVFSKHLDVSR
ncbi:hypothetical protein Zm00014a_022298 [Zea mays]|uniref:C2 domain-containing protein n=1 Tax=Zea mays TaxID=4577 RepID=A0A3L6F1Y9_MAIZE|nr:hypothetical protein Zm00014a_022298 [Zea mays]